MASFKDINGRQWSIVMTVGTVKRVRELLAGVDLFALDQGDPPLCVRLTTDIAFLVDVLYAICKPQADEAGVSDLEFGELMGGEAVLQAQAAFTEALIDFFRQSGRRDRAALISKMQKGLDLAIGQVTQQVESLDLEEQLQQEFGRLSTNTPASSG